MTDLRELERSSIRAFVQCAADEGYLSGRVLDYGCGKQPYRDIVESAGGKYVPFDRADFPANVSSKDVGADFTGERVYWSQRFHAVLCTQVLQYAPDPGWMLGEFSRLSRKGDSSLILTYPTNWPEVEPEDLHRFTKAGMERLLTEAGFEIVRHERRAEVHVAQWDTRKNGVEIGPEGFALGYGCVARA